MSPPQKRTLQSSIDEVVHLKVGKSKFLDKILSQYEKEKRPLFVYRKEHNELRSKSQNQKASIRVKKAKK